MDEKEIERWKERIDEMSQYEMARLHRFAPAGHVLFNTMLPLYEYFNKRFQRLGGMTSEISKRLGW